jgi:hypothetical protein
MRKFKCRRALAARYPVRYPSGQAPPVRGTGPSYCRPHNGRGGFGPVQGFVVRRARAAGGEKDMSRSLSKRARAHARVNQEQLENRILFVQTAGLLVDVDATALPEGPALTVTNAGPLGGLFEARGGGDTVPVIGRPVDTATSGTRGIRMDGTDYLQHVQAAAGDLLLAPAGITGVDATSTVEAWVWNPGIADEETVVAWGKRGGPDGTNASFNYGGNAAYGAVGHWGSPDIGWGPTVPAARNWHHLVWTYDGTTTRVYADGVLANSEVLAPGVINTAPDTPVNIGSQTEADGFTPTGALRGTLTVGKLRIHDGVLTDAQILANYNEEKAAFVEPVIPPPVEPIVKLVDVDATGLTDGSEANHLVNTGTLGGFFDATGGGDTIPVVDQPLPTATTGTRGIRLDGNDYLQHTDATGALLPAPAGIVGAATSSVEVWVWNPGIPGEETMVSWGHRGGPEGTNYSFNYGNDNRWGAMGHWGSPDMGWLPGTVDNAPAARQWHHLVYTFDGTTQRVYVDGAETNNEVIGEGTLNVHAGVPINFGTQIEADGATPTGALRGSLTLGRVRVYDGTLTPAMIAADYNAEKANYVEPVEPPPPPAVKLVDVDATSRPGGSGDNIPNTGSLGGVFSATGGGDTVPVIGGPLSSVADGTKGIRLDGNDYLQLVTEPGGSLITAPSTLTGLDPKQSIEAWVYNPGIAYEETIASWGKRGGPDGTNMSFNYGSSPGFGAVGRWGGTDIGWGGTGPNAPSAQNWHHVAYTYNGNTSRVYVDGVLVNTEVVGEGAVNTAPDTAINIGTQLEADGATPTNLLRGSLTVGKLRIYEGVLTDAQITANFNAEKAAFTNPGTVTPAGMTTGPVHRYSFNNTAGGAGDGTVITDSVGTANGTVLGAGATFNGTKLVLPGGPSASAAYVDLPNGILSSLGAANGGSGQVTFEGWIRHNGNQAWSRIYDFGVSSSGEIPGPGGAGNGVDFFMLTAQTGGDPIRRFETTDNDDGDPTGNRWDEVTGTRPQDLHFVVSWDETTGQVKYYENGREVGGMPSGVLISAITDVNNWLGRSQFTADANIQADYDEFRIYNRILTPGEVLGNFQAGPDVVTTNTPQVSAVYVRGSTWLGEDNNAASTTFGEYLAAQGLGDKTFGYRVDNLPASNAAIVPWINVNEVVLRYSAPVSGAGVPTPGSIVVDGQKQDYVVQSVTALDPQTYVLRLAQPLGGAGTAATNGDRITLTVTGGGPGGTNSTTRLSVVQGDVDRSGSVVANDFSDVKKKFFRSTNQPGPAGDTQYTVFHDVDGSGQIVAADFSEVKKRFFQSLPAPAPAAALGVASVTKDLFSTASIL